MNTIQIDRSLVEFLVRFLRLEAYDKVPGSDIHRAIEGLEWTLRNQPTSVHPTGEVGQKQLPSNPNRTDVGMGAILNSNSEFL